MLASLDKAISEAWNPSATLRAEQTQRINWSDEIEQKRLALPFAVLGFARIEGDASGRWLASGRPVVASVQIALVQSLIGSTDATGDVMGKLIALDALLLRHDNGTAPPFFLLPQDVVLDAGFENPALLPLLRSLEGLAGGVWTGRLVFDLSP